jgi:hypothetical protein
MSAAKVLDIPDLQAHRDLLVRKDQREMPVATLDLQVILQALKVLGDILVV